MSDPVAEFLSREDGALDDDIDVGIQQPVQPQVDLVVENGDDLPVQNGIHRTEGGDSGVDLAAQDILDNSPNVPLSNGHTSRQSTPPVREEHETIKKWREDHARLIKEKDDAEAKKKQEMRVAAAEELKKWKQQYTKEIADRKKQNRVEEQQIQKEAKAQTKGDGWQEVANLVNAVSLKSTSKTSPDTSRMKALLDQKAVA
ncbi:Clathrin light chain domain containing protein [Aphelenchoides bicaudatus]|nr:Clathrin light chain domain containing protein [Aphelenchoides bicaudatus]